jgi:segregation and condensation protein A
LEDPIEILIDMARRGEVDPWNIDVIELADRFLERLEKAHKLDLRVSGRVLLYAAILIRMKADVLAEDALKISKPEIIPEEVDFQGFFGTYDAYECRDVEIKDEVVETLLSPRKKIRRFTTIKDLIYELQMAEVVEERRKKRRKERENDVTRKTLETPHEENIEETIAMVEQELKRLFSRKNLLYFSEVVRGRSVGEKVSCYLSILHLAFRKKLQVAQRRIYEDIELRLY